MRIKISFTNNTQPIPVNNQHIVNSYIHKCLGNNNIYHDDKSNYCITKIMGGKLDKETKNIIFNDDAHIYVTSKDMEFLNTLIKGIDKTDFGYGMKINNVIFVDVDKFYDGFNIFRTLTPILLREKIEDGKYKFITVDDTDFGEKLKKHIINKFSKVDESLSFKNFNVTVRQHVNNKTKTVMVKNVKNVASVCDIVIEGNKKLAETIYYYGLGQSTGSGFGTIYKQENHKEYFNN